MLALIFHAHEWQEKLEAHHGCRIADSALVAAATMSERYIPDRFLPDKAIDLVDEAASRLKLQQESKPEVRFLSLSFTLQLLKRHPNAGHRCSGP